MSPLPPAARRLVLVLASFAVGVAMAGAAPSVKPSASPNATTATGLLGPASPAGDAAVPAGTAARTAPAVQNVAPPQDSPPAERDPSGSFPWVTCGLVLLLLAGNAFAWTRLWQWAPAHGGWQRVFSLSGSRRRKELWEEDAASGTHDLERFHTLLDRMQTILGPRHEEISGHGLAQTSAPRRSIQIGSQPAPESGGASDFQRIFHELAEIRNALGSPRPAAEGRPIALPVGQPMAVTTEPHLRYDPASVVEGLTDQYNAAAPSLRAREEFANQPGTFRLGVRNSRERFHDAQIEPIFSRLEQGEYLAVRLPNEPGRALVFPRFQAALNRNSYQAGAVGLVYHCQDYQDGMVYQEVMVVRPAVFQEAEAGEWQLAVKGELALGQTA